MSSPACAPRAPASRAPPARRAGPHSPCRVLLPCSSAHLSYPLVQRNGDNDEDSLGQHLVKALNAGQVEAALECLDDQSAEQRAQDGAAAAEQAGPADHDRSDAVEVG